MQPWVYFALANQGFTQTHGNDTSLSGVCGDPRTQADDVCVQADHLRAEV